MESTLFIELPEEQQQLIAAGGPTTTNVFEEAFYSNDTIINTAFSDSTVVTGPDGAAATGVANAAEFENFITASAFQNSFAASGYVPEIPTVE